ncbi:MAG: hypothetical protein PW843_26570 [Azospirillaceae bacterium]|nr:hypothetical protein [Azospirillaceae bacterium]
MKNNIMEDLVKDSTLASQFAIRYGKIRNIDLLDDIEKARKCVDNNQNDSDLLLKLEKGLNSLIKDISPITLRDLRSGWSPHESRKADIPSVVFSVSCVLLIIVTAYWTQVYDRASTVYKSTIELQDVRGSERVIKLLGFLMKNKDDVLESMGGGNKDVIYESFNKELFDLERINIRELNHREILDQSVREIDIARNITSHFFWWRKSAEELQQEQIVSKYRENYKNQVAGFKIPKEGIIDDNVRPVSDQIINAPDIDKINSMLGSFITRVRAFNSAISVNFDPLNLQDYTFYIYKLKDGLNILGSWILPCLYGMLGAAVFYIRRLLDSSIPPAPWMQITYRIVLGGFSGIILVWFWTPGSGSNQPSFANISSFGLAFIVGFSTDVLFQALDRLVNYMAMAIGNASQ